MNDDHIQFRALHEGLGFHAKAKKAPHIITKKDAVIPSQARDLGSSAPSPKYPRLIGHLCDVGIIILLASISYFLCFFILSDSLWEWIYLTFTAKMALLLGLPVLSLALLYFLFFKEFKIPTPGIYLCQKNQKFYLQKN